MSASCIVDASLATLTPAGQVEMGELEAQMLSHLLHGDARRAILKYHDAMVVDVGEAKAVVRVFANLHGIRFRI